MAAPGISKLFGLAVRGKRLDTGLTQEALAELAGLHPTYISMVERGVRNPTLEASAQIAKALKIGLPELIAEALKSNRRTTR
jgi:transcriptional regulator with XRE-family HTH domain